MVLILGIISNYRKRTAYIWNNFFRELSLIEIGLQNSDNKSCVTKIERYVVDSKVPEDDDMKSVVEYYLNQGDKDLDRVLGNINSDLDGRFTVVRSSESNLGNFVCDIILEVVKFSFKKLNNWKDF